MCEASCTGGIFDVRACPVGELTDGLNRLRDTWLRKGMPHTSWLRPGLPAQHVCDRLGAAGLTAPREIVDWYSWHDGSDGSLVDGVDGRGAGFLPWFSLDEGLAARTFFLEWAESEREAGMPGQPEYGVRFDDNWLPILDLPATFGILAPGVEVVRVASTTPGVDPDEDGAQVSSLVELVSDWKQAIEDYCTWDRAAGVWVYDFEQFPMELRRRSIL